MKLVYQTKLEHPNGNCLPACIASLLEVELKEVPEVEWWKPFPACYQNINDFLAYFDLTYRMAKDDFTKPPIELNHIRIITNTNIQLSFAHAVVAKGREIIHDPHPNMPSQRMTRGNEVGMYFIDFKALLIT